MKNNSDADPSAATPRITVSHGAPPACSPVLGSDSTTTGEGCGVQDHDSVAQIVGGATDPSAAAPVVEVCEHDIPTTESCEICDEEDARQ